MTNNLPHLAQVAAHKVAWAETVEKKNRGEEMATQNLEQAKGTEFKRAAKADWGFGVKKRRQAKDEHAWWKTITRYLPKPWHPAPRIDPKLISFG